MRSQSSPPLPCGSQHAGSIPGPGPLPGPPGSLLPPADRPPFEIPPNATDTIYVDNLPKDVTQRELSHIFRPFRGFKAVRHMLHLPANCTVLML